MQVQDAGRWGWQHFRPIAGIPPAATLAGARIEEVPFVFSECVASASKMTLRISLEGIRVTLALRRQHRPPRRHRALAAL